jgi:hypothetical protein
MIALSPGGRVYLGCGVTDMRKGAVGLAMLVQQSLAENLFEAVQRHQELTPCDLMVWTAPERHLCARVMGAVTNTRKEPSAMQVSTIGLDLAKQVFQVHAVDVEGMVVLRDDFGDRRS